MKLAVSILIFCVAALLALGTVMLYSSSMMQDGARYLVQQLVWCAVGVVGCAAMTVFDYRHLRRIWWVLLAGAIAMLVLVLIPHVGAARNGARRWFAFGRASFQPSEFAKLALIIALAWYGERHQRQMNKWSRGILLPGVLIGVTAGLIFKEPDVGNALLLCTVSAIVLLVAGIRLAYILPPALLVLVAVGIFISHNQMRSERIHSWLHLEETRKDKGLQAYEAMIALGSGGVTGKGLGDGMQKLGFVPEHHTDFILSIIGEELGVIATLLIVAAFAAIVLAGIYIAVNACDTFGLLLGSGLSFLIGMQAFINVAVVTSVLPNKGLPLPFISYGGSNLVMMLAIVGILLSIARQANPAARRLAGEPDRPASKRARSNPFRGAARPESARARAMLGLGRATPNDSLSPDLSPLI